MSGQTYSTVGGVIVCFNAIMDHLERYIEGKIPCLKPPSIVKQAAEAAHSKMKEYYNKTNMMHCIVTLFDPRCNMEYFERNGFTEDMIDDFVQR